MGHLPGWTRPAAVVGVRGAWVVALLAAIVGACVVLLLGGGLSAVPVLAQGGSTPGVASGGLSAVPVLAQGGSTPGVASGGLSAVPVLAQGGSTPGVASGGLSTVPVLAQGGSTSGITDGGLSAVEGPESVVHAENDPRRVAAYRASGEGGAGVGWSLSGPDSGAFSIDGGVLRFAIDDGVSRFGVPPDYESPVDADGGNDYEVTVEASRGGVTVTRAVTVAVADVDEAGTVSLSATRPRLGVALTAALSDPDGVSGLVSWRWERSVRRNAWTVIAGAAAGMYTPVAADTGKFLRATASYRDGHGADKTVTTVAYEVVTGSLLSGLEVTTNDSSANPSRALMPAFSPEVLHYAVGCGRAGDTMTVTATAASGVRLAIDGVQAAAGTAAAVAVDAESDVHITLTGADGASTTYVVHCLIEPLWVVEATKSPDATGILEDLMLVRLDFQTVAMLDNNGVPRFHRRLGHEVWAYFRVERGPGAGLPEGQDPEYRYSYFREIDDTTDYVVLDQDLQPVDTTRTVAPLETMDPHDFRVLEDGNYLLMAYEPAERDFGGVSFEHPGLEAVQPQATRDSAVQIVTPEGEAVFTWDSWANMPLEDCAQHRFPDDYAHLNSLQMVDGLIVGSFRGCSRVLAIDPNHPAEHKVAWRVGRTNLSAEQWAARNIGPAPMVVVGDPAGEFCGQHAVQVLPNGNLLMFDNGVACLINPSTGEQEGRTGGVYSRAAEYALDPANREAVFVRDHSLHDARSYLGAVHGQVEPLANGDWLISWGRAPRQAPAEKAPDEAVTQVDPDTGEEKFSLRGRDDNRVHFRAIPIHPVALLSEPGPLAAELPASATTSVFSLGTTDAPQVVAAFSRPVVDFAASTPSVSVEGATVTSVEAHVAAGEAANAHVFTLAPEGAGAVTFSLVADQDCASGGICTADATALTEVPAPLVIGPPVTVGFGATTYPTTEGDFVFVSVRLSAAHQGVREVTVPVVAADRSTASTDEFSEPPSVTFAAGETEQTFTILVTPDALDEGTETVELAFGDLPAGVTAGTNPTTAVRIADSEAADIRFSADRGEAPEGGEVRLTFAIHNDVTFQRTETINLAITGTATPGVDFTLADESGRTLTAPYAIAFPPGVSSVTATIHVTDDTDAEPDEDISITASLARRGEPLGTSTIVVQASSGSGPPPPEVVSFSDVPEDAWYADHVQRIAGLGVTTGYPDGTYRPGQPVTQAHMAVFLVRALGLEPVENPAGRFGDVPAEAWYAGHVERIAERAITVGCNPDGTLYCPQDPVTRAQMALLLQRAFDLPEAHVDEPSFDDVADDHDAFAAVESVKAAGITVGCSTEPPKYCGADRVTRAHMAAFLSRAITHTETR